MCKNLEKNQENICRKQVAENSRVSGFVVRGDWG